MTSTGKRRDWRLWLGAAWLTASLLIGGYWLGRVTAPRPPSCPTEDSCRTDYSAGEWHVIQVIP